MELIGWIVWVLFVVWACYSLWGLLMHNPHLAIQNVFSRWAITTVSILQCVIAITIAGAFILYDFSKLHLLWIGPSLVITGIVLVFTIGKFEDSPLLSMTKLLTILSPIISWLMRKLAPTMQPMVIVSLGPPIGLAVVLWTVSVLAHGWISWITLGLAIPVTMGVLGYILYRYGTTWRRMYFGLMDYHSFIVGAHSAVGRISEGRVAFNPLKPLFAIIKRSSANVTDSEIETCLVQWKHEFDTFECRDFFRQLYAENNPSKDQFEINHAMDNTQNQILNKDNYNAYLVRYVIGQVIEKNVGLDQKKRYWKAVLAGKVV